MAQNRVIGRGNALPWHLPADLRRFKTLTMGHTLILGRRTFDAIGRGLPGRSVIVLSRQGARAGAGVEVAPDLETAFARAEGEAEVFVGGGGRIYRLALPHADRVYLTLVHTVLAGDVTFPELPAQEWRLVAEEPHPADEHHRFAYTFRRYERHRTTAR